jgi:hypothetical protein
LRRVKLVTGLSKMSFITNPAGLMGNPENW